MTTRTKVPVCMSFLKIFHFSIVFAALYLSSNSVSGQTGEGRLLSKQRTDVNREGGGGVENWYNADKQHVASENNFDILLHDFFVFTSSPLLAIDLTVGNLK